jgi:hypothetical protein
MEKDQDTVEIRVPASPTVSPHKTRRHRSAISTVTNLFVLIALFSAVLALQYISNNPDQENKDTANNAQPAKQVVQVVDKTEVVVTEKTTPKATPSETDKTTVVDLSSLEKTYAPPKVKTQTRPKVTRRRDIAREDKIMSEKLVNQLDGSYARKQPQYTQPSTPPVASSYDAPVTNYVDDLDGPSARKNYLATNRVETTSYSSSSKTTPEPTSYTQPSGSSSYDPYDSSYDAYGYGSTKRNGIRSKPSYNRWEN